MIGLDTNILLRAVLNDDPVQSLAAQRLLQNLDESRPGLVIIPVLMEFFWVLKSRYKLPHGRLSRVMRELLETEHLEFEALETIGKAVAIYEGRATDFPDAVLAMRNLELGANRTATFDQDAARRIPTMELLS